MRKHVIILIFIIISVLLPSLSMANSYDINHLIVHMRNVGAETCLMRSLKIFQGEMIGGNIPRTLYATGDNYGFVMQGKDIDLTIKYKCGKYKDFSISMKKHSSRNTPRAEVSATFFDVINVFEKHTIEPGYINCTAAPAILAGCSSIPSRINWEISN
jgi:hypothetical protein